MYACVKSISLWPMVPCCCSDSLHAPCQVHAVLEGPISGAARCRFLQRHQNQLGRAGWWVGPGMSSLWSNLTSSNETILTPQTNGKSTSCCATCFRRTEPSERSCSRSVWWGSESPPAAQRSMFSMRMMLVQSGLEIDQQAYRDDWWSRRLMTDIWSWYSFAVKVKISASSFRMKLTSNNELYFQTTWLLEESGSAASFIVFFF